MSNVSMACICSPEVLPDFNYSDDCCVEPEYETGNIPQKKQLTEK